MTVTSAERLVDDYLRRLRGEARRLPRSLREELLQQIQEHLDAAISPTAGEADVRDALERLGDPETIIAEEFDRLGIQPEQPSKLDWIVVFALPFGAVVIPILGWLVGVILLWASRVWRLREKLIGTLLPPGGLSAALYLILIGSTSCSDVGGTGHPTVERCTGGIPTAINIPLLTAFILAGIATPIFLARRLSAYRE